MANTFSDTEKKYAPEQLIKTPVGQLQVGMFVAELDRPWLETPFLIQGFEIRHPSQIRSLKEHCYHVYVLRPGVAKKIAKASAPTLMPKAGTPKIRTTGSMVYGGAGTKINRGQPKRAPAPVVRNRPAYKNSVSARTEHAYARKAFREARQSLDGILSAAQMGNMIGTESARSTVTSCVSSILRNPDAMMWMTKIKHQNEYTAEHCLNVCVLAIAFGRHLNYSEADLVSVGLCGLLHDVGKMRVPLEVLDKPGRLTEEEFRAIQRHTIEGRDLLVASTGVDQKAIDAAFNHHERIDGQGYPRGLPAEDIPEFARVIAIVDAYDAMTSNRCYAKARSPMEAIKIIFENRGSQFDDELALQFIKAIGPYPPGTIVKLRNGMVGIVISAKQKFRHLPTVLVLRDENKQPIAERTLELHLTDTGELGKDNLIKKVLTDGEYDIYLENYEVKSAPGGELFEPE